MSLYKQNEYCLNFERSEIEEYLLEPLKLKFPGLVHPVWKEGGQIIVDKSKIGEYFPESYREKVRNADEEWYFALYPDYVFPVDGESEKLGLGKKEWFVSLNDFINICPSLGKKVRIDYSNLIYLDFFFCDENAKKDIDSSEANGNIVYQGNLRDKTHKEILSLIKDFVELLLDAEELRYEEKVIDGQIIDFEKRICKVPMLPEWEAGHSYYCYDVYLKKQKPAPSIQFENITFHIVDSFK